jgi:hypothetical protein
VPGSRQTVSVEREGVVERVGVEQGSRTRKREKGAAGSIFILNERGNGRGGGSGCGPIEKTGPIGGRWCSNARSRVA